MLLPFPCWSFGDDVMETVLEDGDGRSVHDERLSVFLGSKLRKVLTTVEFKVITSAFLSPVYDRFLFSKCLFHRIRITKNIIPVHFKKRYVRDLD